MARCCWGIVKGVHYYIGYYSALQLHQLITQPSLKEQVVVAKQLTFQFIYHNPTHFFGYKNMWVDNFNKVPCSDLEKTIIDCLFEPAYAGGIVEIAKALHKSKTELQYDKLLTYTCTRLSSMPCEKW